jgi:hypothetical protein
VCSCALLGSLPVFALIWCTTWRCPPKTLHASLRCACQLVLVAFAGCRCMALHDRIMPGCCPAQPCRGLCGPQATPLARAGDAVELSLAAAGGLDHLAQHLAPSGVLSDTGCVAPLVRKVSGWGGMVLVFSVCVRWGLGTGVMWGVYQAGGVWSAAWPNTIAIEVGCASGLDKCRQVSCLTWHDPSLLLPQ